MSKTITIIQLLNKIANGEEMPKKIKNKDFEYIYAKEIGWYRRIDDIGTYDEWFINKNKLNDIVEIIEEQEGIDKLEIDDNGFIHTNNGTWKGRKLDVAFAKAINKLIDEVKNIKEKQ